MTYKYGQKLRFKTLLGDIKEGHVKEVNADGTLFIEVDESPMPDLAKDLYLQDAKGRPFVIYKNSSPRWQAWVKPEWIISEVISEKA